MIFQTKVIFLNSYLFLTLNKRDCKAPSCLGTLQSLFLNEESSQFIQIGFLVIIFPYISSLATINFILMMIFGHISSLATDF